MIVRRGRHTAGEAVGGQYVDELYGSWIIGTVEMNVDVTDDIRYIGSMSGDTRSSTSDRPKASCSPREWDPRAPGFCSSYIQIQAMTHSSQVLHGDEIGREENFFTRSTTPWQKMFVTEMLTRDLFAVDNILVVLYIETVCCVYTYTAVDNRPVPVSDYAYSTSPPPPPPATTPTSTSTV